jgi:hypothetical protein
MKVHGTQDENKELKQKTQQEKVENLVTEIKNDEINIIEQNI